MNTYDDVSQLIGRTPLLRLGRLAPEYELYAKCEFMNPISIKDRPVLQIIAGLSVLALLMTFLPPGQYNLDVLAAFLPVKLAAALGLFRSRSR